MSAGRREFEWTRATHLTGAAALFAVALALFSCSGAPPRIAGIYRELAVVDNRTLNTRYEQLSVFVQPEDEDGFSDLAHLYLINDRAQLFWSLSPDTWERRGKITTSSGLEAITSRCRTALRFRGASIAWC